MRFNRLTSLALCLGVVFLIMTGSAVAGTTSFNSGNALKYAKEVGAVNGVYTLPAMMVNRTMNVIRSTGQNFFVDAVLDSGAKWNGTFTSGSVSVTGAAGVTYTPTLITGTGVTATFLITVGGVTESQYPVVALNISGVTVKDVNNIIGTSGTINITLQTRDSATGNVVDQNVDQVPFMVGAYGVTLDKLSAGAAVIDVATGRKKFVVNTNVTTTTDGSAYVQITKAASGVLGFGGTQFSLVTADSLDFIITGDLSGITYIQIGSNPAVAVDSTALAASSIKLTVDGGTWLNGTSTYFTIGVIGNTVLNTRVLNITINLNMVQPDSNPADTANANDRNLTSNSTLTTWTLNGTVLVAHWVNGNNAALNSRLYLWNKSSVTGMITIDVYTLPASTAGSTKLGTIDYGSLMGSSAVNIKLAEDILNPLAVTLPYTDNGGNLTLVITIRATGVTGISQTFSSGFAYGTYPLQAGN